MTHRRDGGAVRDRRIDTGRRFSAAMVAAALLAWAVALPAPAAESTERERVDEMPAGKIELDETVISGNQELPKVLYILPWQQPDGLPEIELRTEFAEVELFRRLYPPAYRRELSYFEASAAANSEASDSSSDAKE